MEARDPRSRIRPLPPDAPAAGPDPGGRVTARSPVTLVVGAVAVVGLLLGVLGLVTVGGDDEAAPPSTTTTVTASPLAEAPGPTTTTTTLPPTLGERYPYLRGDIVLAVRGSLDGAMVHWDTAAREPRLVPLTSRPDVAAFDAGGSLLMYETSNGTSAALHIGPASGGQPAVFVGVTGARWHPTEPGTVAWAARLPTEPVPALYVATVEPMLGALGEVRRVASLPPDGRLAAFGDWGFAVEFPLGPSAGLVPPSAMVAILDRDGGVVRSTAGSVVAVGGGGVMVIDAEPASGAPPDEEGAVVVLPEGLTIVGPDLEPLAADLTLDRNAAHFITPDGAVVVEASTGTEDGTEILVRDITTPGGRPESIGVPPMLRPRNIGGATRPIGLSTDGVYLLLQEIASNDLLMYEWHSGRVIRVPVPAGTVATAAVT